jgi:hypothetical protein
MRSRWRKSQRGWAGGGDVDAGAFEFDDDVSEVWRRGDEEVHFALLGWGFDAFDFVEFVEAVAGFGAAGFDAGADPFEFFAEEALAAAFGLFGDLAADGFGFEVCGVVSGV